MRLEPIQNTRLGRLKQDECFLLNDPYFGLIVGIVDRLPSGGGYVTVDYLRDGGQHQVEFEADGKIQEFNAAGFRRADWAAGTLVRPIQEREDAMSDISTALVGETGTPTKEIKRRVAKLKEKAKAKKSAKGNSGKPVARKKAEPKVKVKCLCRCGGETFRTFMPGHDARYFGWLKKVISKDKEFSSLPKPIQRELGDVKGVRKALKAHTG